MADRYTQLVNTPIGRVLTRQVGLPAPVALKRYSPGARLIDGRAAARRRPGRAAA